MIKGIQAYLLLLILFNLGFSETKVTTTISGTTIDEFIKQPLANVLTKIESFDYDGNRSFSDTSAGDYKGQYALSVTGSSIDETHLFVSKSGYVFLDLITIAGSNITKDIALSPFDSYITFNINNKLNKADGIFGRYWSNVG